MTPSNGDQPNSRLFKIDGVSGTAEVLSDAPAFTQFRSVALPPQPRANYTCPSGQYGISCDLACAYDCCADCTTSCPDGQTLLNTCSTRWASTPPPTKVSLTLACVAPGGAAAAKVAARAG